MTLQIALTPVSGQPGVFCGQRADGRPFFAPLGDLPEPRDIFLEGVFPSAGVLAGLAGLFGFGATPEPRMRDFANAADAGWYSLSAADKKRFGTIENWWKAYGKDNRISGRASFAALQAEKPNATPAEASKWWGSIGKNARQRLRAKYTKGYDDNVFTDIAKVAKKVGDIVTLTPVISKIPVLGKIHSEIHGATTKLNMLPFKAAEQLVAGRRIDKIALGQFKEALGAAKTLAPYVQTVVSFVPGIGTGLSAGLGAGLALASGRSIDQALLEGVRGAIPGGAIAQAAFDVGLAAAQGKPVEQVVLNALPVSTGAKDALIRGSKAVRALAEGKRVDQVVIDQAVAALPPAAQKAAQIGVALAQAKNIQQGMKIAARGATSVASAAGAALPKMPDVAKLAKQGSSLARQGSALLKQLPAQKRAPQSTAAISDAMRKATSNVSNAFGGKKPAASPELLRRPLRLPAPRPASKKAPAPNKDVLALQKQLNTLLAKERKEDKTQAAQLKKLQAELDKTRQAAAVQDAVQKAVQEALARQAAMQPTPAPQYAQQPMYQPFPGYAPQFAPQAQPMLMPQPTVYASQALPQLSPEDYAAMQLPTALSALHGVLH